MPLTQVSPGLLDSNASTLSFKNRLINPAFQIDQRFAGAAHNVSTTAAYGVDRWLMQSAGATGTGQQSGWPSGQGFVTGLALTGASGVTNLTASQRIERANCADLAGTTANISINAYSATATTLSWALYYPTANDNYSGLTLITTGSWTINSTPTRYAAAVSIPSAATTGLQLTISTGALAAGQTTFITGAQLAPGAQPSDFERRAFAAELFLCERYFRKSYDLNTAVGTATRLGYLNWNWQTLSNFGTVPIIFGQRMRAAPTMTNYNPDLTSTVGGRYWNGSAEVAFTGSMNGWTQYESTVFFNKDSTNSTNMLFQWTASAEL